MSNPIVMRPFGTTDWYGFAGAEAFGPGDEPRIGEVTVDGHAAAIVWDAHGVSVFWEDDCWASLECARGFVPALLEAIGEATTTAALRALGATFPDESEVAS